MEIDMIGSEEILDALKNVGLNLYERKVYVALIAKGVATAGEVSEIAKVPRSRSYDVLESLADKGFVVAQSSKPIKYVALAPKDALERAKDSLHKRHITTIERMDRMLNSPVMNELENIYSQGFSLVQPADIAGTLKGSFAINQQLKSLIKNAKESVNIVTNSEGLAELYNKHLKVLKNAKKAGVRIRILAPETNTKHTTALTSVAEIKKLSVPLGRALTVDGKHFMLALTDNTKVHHTQDVAFWAGSEHVANGILQHSFERLWESQ